MPAIDFASDDQFDKSAPDIESPSRELMNPGEHLNPHQFAQLVNGAPAAPAARHANYIAGQTVHEYLSGGN